MTVSKLAPALLALILAQPLWASEDAGHDDHDHGHGDAAEHSHEEGHDHGDDHAHDEDHAGDDHGHDHDHDHDQAGHDHVHGAAVLTLKVSGQIVEARLTLPGGDLFAEDTADEMKTVATATDLFSAAGTGIALPGTAGCEQISFAVTKSEIEEGDHDGHHDYSAREIQLCQTPEALAEIGITAFTAFSSLETVKLYLDAPDYAVEATLDPDVTAIRTAPLTN